ncbi:MAG: DNA-3-methyladenine glycosylase family protein [Hyphomicrobiales bacterium]
MSTRQITLDTVADLENAIDALCAFAPKFIPVVEQAGTPPLRRTEAGFSGMLRIITGQQLSKASAAAIWQRMCDELSPHDPAHFATLNERHFRAVGQSRPKIRTIMAFTDAVSSGVLDLAVLPELADDDVARALTAVKGIGPWSAEIYLLSCLGRPDVWPAGDLALQVAAADILGKPERLTREEMLDVGEAWRPWRAVAARLLWAWYAHLKGGVEPGVV